MGTRLRGGSVKLPKTARHPTEKLTASIRAGPADSEKVKTKLQKFIKNSNKTRDAFLENGFGGPEAQYFTGIVIDPVFDLLDRFRCDFPEVFSFWEPTADHSIHIFV